MIKREGVYNYITVEMRGGNVMRPQFYDPSLEPIVTTDMDDNILNIRLEGLHHYGYHDMILESDFEIYEELFNAILNRISYTI